MPDNAILVLLSIIILFQAALIYFVWSCRQELSLIKTVIAWDRATIPQRSSLKKPLPFHRGLRRSGVVMRDLEYRRLPNPS